MEPEERARGRAELRELLDAAQPVAEFPDVVLDVLDAPPPAPLVIARHRATGRWLLDFWLWEAFTTAEEVRALASAARSLREALAESPPA
ncbi:hypothetical protein ACQP1W_49735 [Spirillospora sp. CA-255316]